MLVLSKFVFDASVPLRNKVDESFCGFLTLKYSSQSFHPPLLVASNLFLCTHAGVAQFSGDDICGDCKI